MLNQPQFLTLPIQVLRFKPYTFVLLFCLFSLGGQTTWATDLYTGKGSTPPAVAIVAQQTNDLLMQLSERKSEFTENPARLIEYAKDVALSHWDIKRTSRLILGPHWRKASAEERQSFQDEYLKTLLRYVIKAYGYYDERLLEVVEYNWKPLRTGGWVLSKVRIPGGVTVAVDYRMIQDKKTQQWRLIDVRAEGISLVNVKRQEYRQVAKRDGIEGLIKLISAKNDKVLQPIMITENSD